MKKFFLIVILAAFAAGCIRLQGKAGYWHQGSEDESPKGKEIGFDTQNLVQQNRREGSITT